MFLKMNDERGLPAPQSCETGMFTATFGAASSVERIESFTLAPPAGCVRQRYPELEVCLLRAGEGNCQLALASKRFPLNYTITRWTRGLAGLLAAVLAVTPAVPVSGTQPPDVAAELEEAKALYREAKFAQAIAKLQATIGRLEQLRDIQARKIQLSDAHLHLALSYVALNDPTAAKESLKQMLRADRNRTLDPDVYAPKVIELVEEARAEVAKELVVALGGSQARAAPRPCWSAAAPSWSRCTS